MTVQSITLLGSSSGRNAGDAALITGIMEAINSACDADLLYEIPTVRPGYVREHYRGYRVQPISMLPWAGSLKMLGVPTLRSVLRTDMSLVFDAILFDRSLYNPLFNHLWTVARLLPLAKRRGKIVGYYNVGAGPVTTPVGQRLLRELSDRVDFITVRDLESYEILREIGVTNPHTIIGADAALSVPRQDPETGRRLLRTSGLDPDQAILAVNVNVYMDTWAGGHVRPMGREAFVRTFAELLDRVQSELGVPLLFVCTQYMDASISREIIAAMTSTQQKALLSNRHHGHLAIKAALGQVGMLFGMRLHSLILATTELTPVVGIAYQPKVRYYLRTLGLEHYCAGFEDFEPAAVAALVARSWRERGDQRRQLSERLEERRQKADIAARLVAALSAGEDTASAVARLSAAGTSPVEA